MPVPSSINDLSTTPGSNSPSGSESPATADDYLRTLGAFIAQLRDGKADSSTAVLLTGNQTVAGVKTFSSSPVVPDASFALTKLTNIATARILGRSTSGSGTPEELTASDIRAMLGISLDQLAQPGDMKAFTGTSAPSGWLAMPTSATNISRTTYASLFAAIGTTWGAGDGSTTFGCPYCPANHVPVQASGNVGTTTTGALLAHTHSIVVWGNNTTAGGEVHRGTGSAITSTTTESTGGAANLAAGVRVLWCVKL